MSEPHVLRLFTIQMGKWRLARDHGIDMVDTTHASRFQLFSPIREAVYAYKNGTIDEEEYSKIYRETLINSWQSKRQNWLDFLQSAPLSAMACYCGPDKFCHRHLLIKFLEQLCKQLNIPFEYYGELTDVESASKTVVVTPEGKPPSRGTTAEPAADGTPDRPEQPASADGDPWPL